MPWRVYRPAIVVGHSETGAMDKVDGPYYFFPLLKRLRDTLPAWLPLVGVDLGDTNVVPVDYVAKAMDHLAHLPDRDGEAFHLVNPEPQPTVDAGQRLLRPPPRRRSSRSRSTAGSPAGCRPALLPRAAAPGRPAAALLAHRARPSWCSTRPSAGSASRPRCSSTSSFPTVFDSRRTEKALAGSGISVPRPRGLRRDAVDLLGGAPRHRSPPATAAIVEALDGQDVVITGASSGIGQVTALKVAQAGGIPILVARGKDKLEDDQGRRSRASGGTAYVYPCDLSDLEAIDALCEQLAPSTPTHRLRGQQRRPLDPPLAASSRRTASTTSSAPCSSTTSARSGW